MQYKMPGTTAVQKRQLAWNIIREISLHSTKEEEVGGSETKFPNAYHGLRWGNLSNLAVDSWASAKADAPQ
jgi:hypothetical protein